MTEPDSLPKVSPLLPPPLDVAHGEDRYRLLVETVSDYAIFLLDPTGHIQSWNAGAQRIKGYTADEAIGRHFSIFYLPEDIARNHPQYELKVALETGKFEEEGWRLRKDGTRFWANVLITCLKDADGRHIGFAKVTRDLTLRKAAEEQLRLSEERYRLLVLAVKDYAIFMLDPEGRVATWNEGAQRLKGYTAEEIIGEHFSKFYPEEDIRTRKPQWELDEALMTGRLEDEGWRLRKDGTRFWANVLITPIRTSEGKLLGYSKVTRDMTDRRRLEEKLRRTNEELDRRVQERTAQLEEAVRARDEFMSVVSHELRTPVTSMKLQVQTAQRQLQRKNSEGFLEKAQRFVDTAGRQLDRLARLIDDMFDVSRISMDRLKIEPAPIELGDLVRETVERLEDQCRLQGCSVQVSQNEPIRVHGDAARLEQVVSNLVINAMKYGQGKPIHVMVRKAGDRAHVSVQDQGMGIAIHDQERIFRQFERAVPADTISGMGLGLFISWKIIEAHHGKITVDSALGKGSTFTVVLPALD